MTHKQHPPQSAAAFFDVHQRQTVEAAMARIIPTDDLPGAREADTITFLDRYLSGIGYVFAKPDGSGFETLQGIQANCWQQRLEIIREKYIAGIKQLDEMSQSRFKGDFVALTAAQQDEILSAMERPANMPEMSLEPALQQTNAEIQLDFFPLLCLHTRQGFYADPIYGGNKNRVGWEVIGFPGPKSLKEVHTGAYTALPWFAEGHNKPVEEMENDL